MGFQKGPVAPRLVGAAAEQRDAGGRGAAPDFHDGRLCLGAREPREVTRHVLLPGDPLVEIGA